MSIPLMAGKNQQMPIQEVRIANDQNWQKQHLKTIQSIYGRSPYFMYYCDELTALFVNKETFLIDFNFKCLHWILEKLKINLSLSCTTSFQKEATYLENDLRSKLTPWSLSDHLVLQLPGCQDRTAEISILDILFFLGPDAAAWIFQSRKNEQIIQLCAKINP